LAISTWRIKGPTIPSQRYYKCSIYSTNTITAGESSSGLFTVVSHYCLALFMDDGAKSGLCKIQMYGLTHMDLTKISKMWNILSMPPLSNFS
jgi:hypothetical protein